MGAHQSVEADGNSGWLASSPFAGCCAPGSRSDEEVDPFQTNRGNGRRKSITNEQPRSLRPMLLDSSRQLPRPSTGQSMRQWVGTRQVESRTPGYPHLSMRPSRKASRPLISAPTDFRHIDGSGTAVHQTAGISRPAGRPAQINTQPTTLRRKPSFRPLQLSIYLPDNQLSPLPDFTRNSWDRKPDKLAYPSQARVRNRADSLYSEAGYRIPRKPIPSYVEGSFGNDADARTIDIPLRPVVKRSSTMPVPERPRTINADLCTREREFASPLPASGPSSPRMRSNTEPLNPSRSLRKRPSYRSPRDSVEDAISELNSIVEERRAKKAASNSPKQHHVPALAPNFKMHVRSETLSDIGSALSVPFTSKPLPSIPPSPVAENDRDSAYDSPAIRSVTNSQTDLLTRFPTPPDQNGRNHTTKSRIANFMQRRRNNTSVDSTETLTSSKFSHSRTATDDTLNSFASSATATSSSPFYHGPSPLALQSNTMSSHPYASPSLASTAANCPTNSTMSIPATISTFRDDGDEEEDGDDDNSDARSSTPDTNVSTPAAPLPAGVSPRNLSVPSFGVAMEHRERQGKSWSAVVEEMDDKKIESGELVPFPPVYVDSDNEEEERGRSRYSTVGVAF